MQSKTHRNPTRASTLPPHLRQAQSKKNNSPALCEWAKGTQIVDLLSANGVFIHDDSHIPNARKQPSQFQIASLKNSLKKHYKYEYNNAVRQQIRETCPFNIYGRIIFKSKSGCAYYYSLLNHKRNKTLLWENSRLSFERDWEKHNIHVTIEIQEFEKVIKSILNIKHQNYLKQFMIKLFRNNLYFKNVTAKFTDSGTKCFSCMTEDEDRAHFFLCVKHTEIIKKLFQCFVNLKILKKIPDIVPFFFNNTMPTNHPTNIIYITVIKFMYNLRYSEIIPNLQSDG